MNTNNKPGDKIIDGFFGGFWYFMLALVISVPIYLAVKYYVRSIGIREDDSVSFATTFCFIMGVFAGRYIVQFWLINVKELPKGAITILVILLTACIAWIFLHSDFPLGDRPGINLMLFWFPFAAISFGTGALVKIVHKVSQHQLQDAQTQAAQSKSELHLLQSQLSPHFLFNTLNNLYGLSITNHEKIPPLLLKLSELLRYSVYNTGEVYVSLKEELAYIKNYIEFEKIRIGKRLILTTDIEEMVDADVKVPPMLLIVFIENAFKHSKDTAAEEIFIDIKLKLWGSFILFSVRNTYGEANTLNKNSGVGLPNVTKRLKLLYPDAHDLNIYKDERFYQVELQLKNGIK